METNPHLHSDHFSQQFHQLKFIAASVPIHLNYLDHNEVFRFVNEAAANFWGHSIHSMLGKTIRDLLSQEDYDALKPLLRRVLKGETISHESTFKDPDGEIYYFRNNYIPDINQEGQVVGFVATGTDITEEKKAFDKAYQVSEEFRTLADSMPQIVWTANPDGHVDYYNKRWYEFTGLPANSADNSLWTEILYPEDAEILYTTWERALKTGEPYEVEFRVKHAQSGEYRWLLSRARPSRDENNNIIKWYGSNTDIHEQKSVLENFSKEQRLREQIVATLSHDLRTPLTSAKISAQLMLRKQLGPDIQKLAFRIEENMTRADHMIQDLLDASKVKAGHKLPININNCNMVSVASAVVEEFTMLHGHRFQFKAPQQLLGEWDCDGIRRILENLISNAIKYGDQLKQIIVTIGERDNRAMMQVTNFGKPIPNQDITGLFDPYKRVDANQNIKGWGLGLNLVKGLTEAHGGHVMVKSSELDGTTFTICLPFKQPGQN